jgi:hypothetical protein
VKIKRTVAIVATSAFLLVGGIGSAAFAGGTGGGDFTCDISGVPGWGHVTSSYKHPSRRHHATAVGTGYVTVTRPAGTWAVAKTGRTAKSNYCYWGLD